MRKVCVALTLVMILLLPEAALAWNSQGHKTVACIAWLNMSPKAKAQALVLLKQHPQFNTWVKGFPQDDETRGMVAFINAATWPDVIKNQAGFTEDKCPNKKVAPNKLGFKDKNRHRFWHFIDVPFTQDGSKTIPACVPNVQVKIEDFINAIGNSSVSAPVQAYDLTWMIHLVGDVHQPLHALTRFTKKEKNGDAGGVNFKINSSEGALHFFWDDLIGTGMNQPTIRNLNDLDAFKILAQSIMKQNPRPSSLILLPQAWVTESVELGKSDAYSIGADEPNEPPPTPSGAYRMQSLKDARQRAALAGYRLAAVLNEKFQ